MRTWGTSPPYPLGFSALGKKAEGPTDKYPPAGPEGRCPLHGTALGLRPRRALPSEPQKLGSTRQTPVLCFSRFPARQRRCADTKQDSVLYLSKTVLLSRTWGAPQLTSKSGSATSLGSTRKPRAYDGNPIDPDPDSDSDLDEPKPQQNGGGDGIPPPHR